MCRIEEFANLHALVGAHVEVDVAAAVASSGARSRRVQHFIRNAVACLLQLASSAKELRSLRIVLMSATAAVPRYSEFMRPLCEQGQVPGQVALGESAVV